MTLKLRGQWPRATYKNLRYSNCYLCSANKYKRIHLSFNSGSTEPSTDDTLTGASSSATGILTDLKLLKGSWSGGDAEGYIEMKTYTGSDTLSRWGTEDENINSTVSDNILTLDGYGHVKIYGLLYPDDLLVEIDSGKYSGKKLCVWHAQAFMKRQAMDDADISTEEDQEGSPDLES